MSKIELVRKTPVGKGVKDASKRVGNKGVFVGILKGTGIHPNSNATYAEIAWWNEFGTKFIPSRPFLRPTIKQATKSYKPIMKDLLKQVMLKKMSAIKAAGILGLKAQSDVQKAMVSLKTPANAESTKARKGSSNPLIDTGALRQHINWIVE
jgi:hypothetical protein